MIVLRVMWLFSLCPFKVTCQSRLDMVYLFIFKLSCLCKWCEGFKDFNSQQFSHFFVFQKKMQVVELCHFWRSIFYTQSSCFVYLLSVSRLLTGPIIRCKRKYITAWWLADILPQENLYRTHISGNIHKIYYIWTYLNRST